MAKFLIGALIGIVAGGVAVFFIFIGVPRAGAVPGSPVLPPDPNAPPAATAEIVLREEFFNSILGNIFTNMNDPSFSLSNSAPQPVDPECSGNITVLPEGSGVRTSVSFANDRLESPLAFNGSYNSPFGCVRFSGWANSVLELRFDRDTQSVFGQFNVETVNLEGVNPLVNAIATPLVQSTLNARVNPIKIVDGRQIAINVPITSANANLIANVNDVRAEVREKALRLYIRYDLGSGPLAPAQ